MQNHEVTLRFRLMELFDEMGAIPHIEPVLVRQIDDIDMSLVDFFALFKSFDITISRKGNMEGKEYSVTEDI